MTDFFVVDKDGVRTEVPDEFKSNKLSKLLELSERKGAGKMLKVCRKWLNTEPILDEIWRDYDRTK